MSSDAKTPKPSFAKGVLTGITSPLVGTGGDVSWGGDERASSPIDGSNGKSRRMIVCKIIRSY